MALYKNLSGNSGVKEYKVGSDWISVVFQDGAAYLYNYRKPGLFAVETMKKLAAQGKGLSTFISTKIRENYARKLF